MKKVIVFGGAGFLGSHTADALTAKGYEVIVFDRVPSTYLIEGQKGIVGDILDIDEVEKAIKGCDIVYNFAAVAELDKAKHDPISTVKNNILGNTITLEASRRNGVKRFMYASSLYVYSNRGSFYRSSKQACELIIENYHQDFGMVFTIMRYGSLYGPRTWEDNWIYSIIKQALVEGKIERDGDGDELREYIHVQDAARMGVLALSEEYENQHVIITGNQQIRIRDLLTMIREMLRGKIDIKYKPSTCSEHYEITPYVFKPTMAKRIVADNYVDLGQGVFEMLGNMYKEVVVKNNVDNIVI